jgi:signal transduction histidine kinase
VSVYLSRGASDGRRALARVLSAFGSLAVGWALVSRALDGGAGWVAVVGLTGVAAWLVDAALLPRSGALFWTLIAVRLAAGAVSGPPSDVTGLVPGLVALLVIIAAPTRSLVLTVVTPLSVVALSAVSVIVSPLLGAPVGLGAVIGTGVALFVSVLGALSRRQFRAGEEQTRQLLHERLESAQERERVAALAERSRIARDLHDVLAHSLGGLVLQLDATEALLESGRTDEALARVRSARGLAAAGLEDARGAVAALRDPELDADPAEALARLVATHRELGGRAELTVSGSPGDLAPERAAALHAAAREALTNARRYAPDSSVELRLEWSQASVALRVSSALPVVPVRSVGGGYGLRGIDERMRAAGGRSTAGPSDGSFVLTAEMPR